MHNHTAKSVKKADGYKLSVELSREEYEAYREYLNSKGGIPLGPYARRLILADMGKGDTSTQGKALASAMKARRGQA